MTEIFVGHFLAVTAIRSESTQGVTRAVGDYLQSHGVDYEVLPAATPLREDRDAQLFAPNSGWIVVLWPTYFNLHDFALAKSLASREGRHGGANTGRLEAMASKRTSS